MINNCVSGIDPNGKNVAVNETDNVPAVKELFNSECEGREMTDNNQINKISSVSGQHGKTVRENNEIVAGSWKCGSVATSEWVARKG